MEKTSSPQDACTSLPGCYNEVSLGAQLLRNKINSLTALEVRGTKNEQKAMATHSSTLAWRIPLTEEPGGLQSMGSLRVGHD